MSKHKYVFKSVFFAMLLFSCAPSSNSSYDFDLPYVPQIFWTAAPQDFESFVVAFAQKFDPKFVNAFVASDLSVRQYQVHEITLNRSAFTDIDNKPYRLTLFIAWATRSSDLTSFLLMNEENVNNLEFPVGTLAFGLNAEPTKALDAKFKRQAD